MDMNVTGGSGFGFPPPGGQEPDVKKLGDVIAKMVGSVGSTPRFSASHPITTGPNKALAPPKELIKTIVRSVREDGQRAAKATTTGIANMCGRMAQLELAEAIANEANSLKPDKQSLFWKNIAAYTLDLKGK